MFLVVFDESWGRDRCPGHSRDAWCWLRQCMKSGRRTRVQDWNARVMRGKRSIARFIRLSLRILDLLKIENPGR